MIGDMLIARVVLRQRAEPSKDLVSTAESAGKAMLVTRTHDAADLLGGQLDIISFVPFE